MTEDKDLVHIENLKRGDFQAYSYLVNKYKNMVYTITVKIIKNPEEAEDITQESFIKAYQQIHNFKKESKFSTWLYTIAYRSALYHMRKNRIDVRYMSYNDNEKFQSNSNDPIEDFKLKERQQFIKKAIDQLPTMEGLLITLFYIDENSIEEIHSITGLSSTNIKVKLFRARKKLKNTLDNLLKGESKSIL